MDKNSLAHTQWECKYHIIFTPKYSVSEIIGYLKGERSLMIFEKYDHLKYKYENRHFWCGGYYNNTVENAKKIKEYLQRNY